MPQLLGLMLIGVAAVAGFRAVQRAANLMSDAARRAAGDATAGSGSGGSESQAGMKDMKDLGSLELDAQSGVYKPRRS